MRLQDLKSHEHSGDHKAAVAMFLRDDDASNVRNVASSTGDFKEVLPLVRAKKLPKSCTFARRKKLRAMIYALAEAVRHWALGLAWRGGWDRVRVAADAGGLASFG